MSEMRNFTTEELIGKLDTARGWIHNAYLEYSNDGTPDAVLVGARAQEVVAVTKALHAKGYIMSEEERAANQTVINLSREIRGLPKIGGPDLNATVATAQPPLQLFKDYSRFKLVFDDLVDQNDQMSEAAKVRHLIEHLEGKAADLVSPYIGLPGAYAKMREVLREEYEEPKHLKEHLKAEIEKLPRIADKYDDRCTTSAMSCTASSVLYSMVLDRFSDRIADDLVKKDFSLKDLLERFSRWRREKENMISAGRLKPKADSADQSARAPARPTPRRVAAGQSTRACCFCGSDGHFTDQCNHPPGPHRCKELAARQRLCFVCLRAGHRASDRECPLAPPPNNHYLPPRRASPVPSRSAQLPPPVAPRMLTYGAGAASSSSGSQSPRANSPSSQPKAIPYIQGPVRRHYLEAELNGQQIRILLDSGADVSLIERRLVPDTRQIFRGAAHQVMGIGGASSLSEMCRVKFAGNGVAPIGLPLYVQDNLPDVDIIVGRFEIPLLLKSDALDEGRLYYDTLFGRVYMSDRAEVNHRLAHCFRAAFVDEPTNALVKELTVPELETEIPLEVKQMPSGRFSARLPFLPGQKPRNNFWSAKHRQVRLQERLERTGLTDDYRAHLMEYVENGHAVPAPQIKCLWADDAFYLPHREVIKETSSSTRFRIVFDASAGAPSLNDQLFKGNAEQLKLPDCLMRFRSQPVAVIADISKAFLQIEIDPADQSYLRFLWLDGPDLQVYQMCRLPFGLVSSPAILIQVINTLIDQHSASYPFAADLLKNAFYIPRVNRIIDRVLRLCVPCQKSRLKLITQPVSDFPQFWHQDYLPFGNIASCAVPRTVPLKFEPDYAADACLAEELTPANLCCLSQSNSEADSFIVSGLYVNFRALCPEPCRRLILLEVESDGGRAECQGIFLEVMASDEAIRERSRAWSCGWLSHRLAAAQRLACEQSDDVNVRGAFPRVVSPPHVPPLSQEGI
ncbi:hypothetical protein TYRP_010356 [Tyrophagus putrescentiae]|nr:hypothetical protein TYRP_010356 [Tyrophagus putrescentiae]